MEFLRLRRIAKIVGVSAILGIVPITSSQAQERRLSLDSAEFVRCGAR